MSEVRKSADDFDDEDDDDIFRAAFSTQKQKNVANVKIDNDDRSAQANAVNSGLSSLHWIPLLA